MIIVSFVELLDKSIDNIGFLQANIAFFVGIFFLYVIDVLIPHRYKAEEVDNGKGLMKVGILTAVGIAIHNFPEGFAVFAGALKSLHIGGILALAIAIHNIPEGISVSAPIFFATGDRVKAFKYSFISGIFEPLGATIGAVILLPFLTDYVINWTLAFVGGIMVYISLDELIPAAHKYGREHTVALGVIIGMILMSASLLMLT
jgi:ZIP family zinc transporter